MRSWRLENTGVRPHWVALLGWLPATAFLDNPQLGAVSREVGPVRGVGHAGYVSWDFKIDGWERKDLFEKREVRSIIKQVCHGGLV